MQPPVKKTNSEQRKTKRFAMQDKTFFISSDGVGQLINISEGGLSAKFIEGGYTPKKKKKVSIVSSSGNFSIVNISYKLIWQKHEDNPLNIAPYPIKIGVQFQHLTATQAKQILTLVKKQTP